MKLYITANLLEIVLDISTHRFRRVPTIDECYMDDQVCKKEASVQYFRDRGVEGAIVKLLFQRFNDCVLYEYPDQVR